MRPDGRGRASPRCTTLPSASEMRRAIAIVALLALALPALAKEKPYRLEPFKDELFQYATILETAYDGAYREVLYDRPRDLVARSRRRHRRLVAQLLRLGVAFGDEPLQPLGLLLQQVVPVQPHPVLPLALGPVQRVLARRHAAARQQRRQNAGDQEQGTR